MLEPTNVEQGLATVRFPQLIAVESVCFAIWPPRPKKDAKNPRKYLCRSQFPR